ncbi:hypothetical protein BGZ80_002563 [Entomortierella chlamydospora]|uniref:Peptidase A1 domain-containing protein n=1 Tax=Entomortierella chlamydospora TaxID=101097 RepID=A0A9P6MQ45_9FUNG|nr:hypothetical protein BGZ80_002563 [Entomortierella chlamydospora]
MYGDNFGAAGVLASDTVDVGSISDRQTDSTLSSLRRGVKTSMDNAIAANVLAQPVVLGFSTFVRRSGGKDGHYLFGGIDEFHYASSLTYVPMAKKGYWQVHNSDVKVVGVSTGVSFEGIIDIGTTLIVMGNAVVVQLHKSINGATYSSSL